MARPNKDEELLSDFVRFRIRPSDKKKWLEKVATSNMTESEFFRDCVLENKTEVIARKQPSEDHTRLVYLFNKVGNNINQLAHRANSDYLRGQLGRVEYDRLIYALEKIVDWHHKVLNHVD